MPGPFTYPQQPYRPRRRRGLVESAVDQQLTAEAYANLSDPAYEATEARRANSVGRDMGLPGATMLADIDGFQREVDNRRKLGLLTSDPEMTRLLADPNRAAAVKDDLPSLAEMSAILRFADDKRRLPGDELLSNYRRRAPTRLPGDLLTSTYFPRLDPRRPLPDFENAPNLPQVSTSVWKGAGATVDAALMGTGRGIETFLADMVGYGDAYRNSQYYKDISANLQFAEMQAQAPAQRMEQEGNWIGARAYNAGQSIELMGLALVTKRPIAALGIQVGAQQYGDVRARGGTPLESLVSGGVTGAAESLFERYFGLGWMLGNFGKRATSRFIGGLLLREVPSEVATTAVQDLADALVTGGEGWKSYVERHRTLSLDNPLVQTAASTALMVGALGGLHGVARRLKPQAFAMQEIEQAAAGGEFLDRLADAAERSKTKQEDPETLAEFIEQRTESTPLRHVYVPVEKAVEYMQSDAYKGELDRYETQIGEAQATQGDVVIPIGEAVAHLAGTPAWVALKDDMRVSPGGLSRNEAKEQHDEIIRVLEQRGKEIAAEAQDADTNASAAAEVYTEVKNRLRVGGVDERQADAIAQIYAARYEARASRMGGTPIEQFQKSKIVFPGESADVAGRQFGQDVVVNIGLNVPGGGSITAEQAVAALKKQGVEVTASEVRASATEPTLVARLSKALTPKKAQAVSKALKQEAIAQRVDRKGELHGPAAEKWGPFDPAFFLEPGMAEQLGQERLLEDDVLPEAGWTAERISGLIDAYGQEDGSSSAVAVMMSPDEYLGMLANKKGRAAIAERAEKLGPLDIEQLRASPPIVLRVKLAGKPSAWQVSQGTGPRPMVSGHDGRHRMTMLKAAGFTRVPVVVQIDDSDGRPAHVKDLATIEDIIPNRTRADQLSNGDLIGAIRGGVPISWKFKDQLGELGNRVLFQSPTAPIFYSALERAVQNSGQAKASGEQWTATLRKTPGVKQEELEWSGILDFLPSAEGPITREQLAELLAEGGIQVEEVELGRPIETRLADYGLTMEDLEGGENADAPLIVDEGGVQFQSWSSDPSNPTYRELLLTLPPGVRGNPQRAPSTHWDQEGVVAHTRFMDKTDADGKRVMFIEEVQSDWHQKGRDEGYQRPVSKEVREELQSASAQAMLRMGEANKTFVDTVEKMRADAAARGGKQSKKLQGYFGSTVQMTTKLITAENFMQEIGEEADPTLYTEAFEAWKASDAANLAYDEASQRTANALQLGGIPEAPFKSSWPALVMKRVIRWAVDNGYERVAWTTGEEQAQRYNLSEAVGSISIAPDHELISAPGELVSQKGERVPDSYIVALDSHRATTLLASNMNLDVTGGALRMNSAQIKEAFGADLGKRLIEGAEEKQSFTARDQDLKIGGEGMKAFYDRNLVNITNDIIKKYGAKVGKLDIGGRAKKDTLARIAADLDRLTGMSRPRDAMGRSRVWTPEEIDQWMEGNKQRLETARQDRPEVVDIFERRIENHQEMRQLAADWWRIARDEGEPLWTNHGFEITDKMREAASSGFALFQGERGRTTFTDSGQRIIELFAGADRSTLLHETGHIWLEELKQDGGADWAIVKKWFAANGAKVSKTGFIPTQAHELWARGFERYLMEGKAPSVPLRGVFQTFKAWLLRLYQVVQNLQSPITPEIREVLDRLLATDEAIADARAQNATEPLFKTAEDAKMTEAEFADYQARVADARDEAYDALLFKTMEKLRREKTAEMREARSSIRDEIAQEIARQPQFRLLHLLRTGRWLGEPEREPQRVKLNTGWLIDNFGEDILDKLPRGLKIIAGDGETGDTIAEMVGMESGTAVVHALVGQRAASDELRARGETRSLRDLMVDVAVDERMAELHGDALMDGSIEEEAIAAINTARQGEIIASEARQLAKRKSLLGVPTPYQFAREWARRTVSAGHVRDVASRAALQRYIRASNKAARAAEKAILEGDTDEAYRQKQAQLLNHALLAEAKAAADRVDTIVARLNKLGKRAAMKSVDPEYLNRIHILLENYDFRDRTQRSIDEQEDFQVWAERQRERGYEVHIPVRLENRGEPYTRVSVQELDSLNDIVESLLALGRTKQKLKVAQQERDFGEFRDEVVARLEAMKDRRLPTKPINEDERLLAAAAGELLKVETIVEEMDGGKTGPLHDAIVVGATNAENRRFALREKVLKPIADLYNSLGRKQWRRLQERVTIPELTWNTLNEGDPRTGQQVTITRMELLSVLMNMGNLSNLEKLSKGERWPVETLRSVMNRELKKEDFDLAQKLWDQVGLLWTDIVETERQMAGVVPEKVVNAEFETPYGTYRGGYWPVVYDAARWQRAEDLEAMELDDMFGLKSGVATQKGHTIERTGAFGPINLSIENVLFRHIEQVVTRIAFADYARDVLKIVRDRSIRGLMDTKVGPEYRKQIEKWLARQVHEGAVYAKAARWWDKTLRQFRINMTIAAMGLRVSTGVAQTLGLTASAERIGARWVGLGLKRVALSPRTSVEFAFTRSPELLHRAEAVNREIAELSLKMRHKHSWWSGMQHWAMWHIGLIDRYAVALPTWLGAHAKAISEGMTDEEASAQADKEVRMSQGAGREKDLAAFQSPNSEAMRFFSMFYTPWNVLFNAQWQAARDLRRGDPRKMIGVTFWWLTISTLGDAMLSGDWPDDEPEDWARWLGRNAFFGLFAGLPLIRDFTNAIERRVAGQYSDYSQTPVTRVYEAIDKAWKAGKKLYKGEDIKNPIKQTGDISATLLGVPSSQPGATAQFLWDVHEGKSDPESLSDWYFGLTKGKVPDDKDREPEGSKL